MARKLKVFQTSQGFFDLAIAAPSMKAALEAWGASSNLFHQGFAKESEDDAVIAAAMAKPGIVLRRPVGSSTAFKEHAELPSAASLDARLRKEKAKAKTAASAKPSKRDGNSEREAAAKYAKEERQRDKQRAKEEAEAAKAREKRNVAIEKAQAALLQAEGEHEENADALSKDLQAVQQRVEAEEERWRKQKVRLEADLRKAKD
ncbi:cell envelope biogenesis protein TolA [Bradyrhizobium sp. I1.7.5]|uniref:cell envelope biogenesis protein TolA n=1 Tax=Bradyrhizobium sp. I1.7.5 TaxID=3156363 RepID=UPI00339AD8E4